MTPHPLSLTVVALLASHFIAGEVRAQAAAPGGGACATERQALESQRASLDSCRQRAALTQESAQRCTTALAATEQLAQDAGKRAELCEAASATLCEQTSAFVQNAGAGKLPLAPLSSCAPAAAQAALAERLAAHARSASTLARLEAFSRGETDGLAPRPVAGRALDRADVIAARLAGLGRGEAPLVYRRLLVEAVDEVAPLFWRRLRAGGPEALEAWFAAQGELEPAFVAEAQRALAAGPGAAVNPSQAAALQLVQSYLAVAGCDRPERAQRGSCARAKRLENFLESSAPLLVRQRLQEIWHTHCSALEPRAILGWLRDFASPQPALGKGRWDEIARAAYEKIASCYLAEPDAEQRRFAAWLAPRLPAAAQLTSRTLERVDLVRAQVNAESADASCLDAVAALRALPTPTACALPPDPATSLERWFARAGSAGLQAEGLVARSCAAFVAALWKGQRPRVAETLLVAPTSEALVRVEAHQGFKATSALRALCQARTGAPGEFPEALARLSRSARLAGEDVAQEPWRFDEETQRPREDGAYGRALGVWAWILHALRGTTACEAIGLREAQCRACAPGLSAQAYDCALLAKVGARWKRYSWVVAAALLGLLFVSVGSRWVLSMSVALRRFGAFRRETKSHLGAVGFTVRGEPGDLLFPSRRGRLRLVLPGSGGWERWGRRATLVRSEGLGLVGERDVTRAALAARAAGAELALLVHDEGAAPDLPGVRAMLDWAARGPRRAVQVLPISFERVRWVRTPDDLLDLIEQTSLRGNPFEMRGRLVSSSQFFNRERLVSGLLAASQAGHWTVVTGLRRFGKSSLALEVARRLQGPYGYVDLAGFHHEVAAGRDVTAAADTILRFACQQLSASAEAMYRTALDLPPPAAGAALDSAALGAWVRAFVAACRRANGDRPLTALVILDEVEQAIGVGPERIQHAVDVLSIVVGRLRACLSDTLVAQGGDRIGVMFCSAVHPLLWAPLATLDQQSLLGAFPSVFVPRLPGDAADAMMRGLGARQGIRFTDPALTLIVRETLGIPMLVRRIGSAVLELYDPERARQGSLGAVEIGVEGAKAAVRREEEEGAPLRVWVESEIGDVHNPAGVLLRLLAREGSASVEALKARAAEVTAAQFVETGVARLLSPEEAARRAAEAAGYIVRMLSEIGMLEPEGGLTQPERLRFPDSLVRRILAAPRRGSPLGF